jgi:dynactin 1
MAKFFCLGAAASLSIVHADGDQHARLLGKLYHRVEQASNQASNICFRLTSLDVQNTVLVKELEEGVDNWKKESTELVNYVRTLLFSTDGSIASCSACVENVLKEIAKLLQTLRSAKLNPADDESFHALSPEANDPWEKISILVRSIRGIDGDHEDVNYLIRARDIERHLEQAIDNEPKLEQTEAKVSALEKTLSSRSKEVAMQNARLSELEKVVAKSSTGSMGRVMSAEAKSVEEYNSLREENRVLTEAMDVVQRQVDEYENEIRALKDFKSPKRAGATRGTPRRSVTSSGDFGSPGPRSAVEEKQTSTGMLEATIFRPALQQALEESARWKTSVALSLLDIPPLPMPKERKMVDEATNDLHQLSTAIADYRLELASIKLVDLTRKDKTPREQLRENKLRSHAVTMNLESVLHRCRGRIV